MFSYIDLTMYLNMFDVICNSEWIKYNHKKNIKIWCYGPFKKKNFYKEMLIFGNVLATSASTINRNFLTKNNLTFSEKKEFVTCEDYDFFLHIAKLNGKFKAVVVGVLLSLTFCSLCNIVNLAIIQLPMNQLD